MQGVQAAYSSTSSMRGFTAVHIFFGQPDTQQWLRELHLLVRCLFCGLVQQVSTVQGGFDRAP